MISYFLSILFKVIYLIIIVAVLLSWIQIFDTKKEPFASILRIFDIIMAPFRAVIPPIGMIDISPVVAVIVLQLIERLLFPILANLGI